MWSCGRGKHDYVPSMIQMSTHWRLTSTRRALTFASCLFSYGRVSIVAILCEHWGSADCGRKQYLQTQSWILRPFAVNSARLATSLVSVVGVQSCPQRVSIFQMSHFPCCLALLWCVSLTQMCCTSVSLDEYLTAKLLSLLPCGGVLDINQSLRCSPEFLL